MQQPTERPEPRKIMTLARLLGSAEDLLVGAHMLPDLEGKAFFDRECYEIAKSKRLTIPPCCLPIVWMSPGWTHSQCEIDEHGKRTDGKVPSFGFWTDLMRIRGPWIEAIGVETARIIASLLADQESRQSCFRALGILSPQDDKVPSTAETQRKFHAALKNFGHKMPSVTPVMILAEERELPRLPSHEVDVVEGVFAETPPLRIIKGEAIDVDSEFFAGAK